MKQQLVIMNQWCLGVILIKELIINNESILIDLYNNLIYEKYTDILNLYKYFDECINEKNKDLNVKIGDKNINNKDYILYNFMDVQTILESIKYKKNSLLFDYLNSYLLDNITDIDDLNEYVKKYFLKYLKNCNIDLNVNSIDNTLKIFSNCLEIIPNINNYIEKINYMLKYIISNNLNKTVIIFLNSDNFYIPCNFENIIFFDISKKININNNNILITDNFYKNLDFQIILEYLEKNWPIQFNKESTLYWLKYYFINCFSLSKIKITNDELLIIAFLLKKMYKLNQTIYYSNKTNNIIKSYIANL